MARNNAVPGLIILVTAILGFFIAVIEQLAYESGYVLDEYLASASELPGLQILTIIVFMLMGCVLAAVSSK